MTPEYGPIGKTRKVYTPLLLGIVTLGIYSLVWIYKVHYEVMTHTKDQSINPALAVGLLFVPIFNLFWGIYLTFSIPGLVRKMEIAEDVPSNEQTSSGVIGFVGLIPVVNIIWCMLVQNALNKHWAKHTG